MKVFLTIALAFMLTQIGCDRLEATDEADEPATVPGGGDCPPDETLAVPGPPDYAIGWDPNQDRSLLQCTNDLQHDLAIARLACQLYCAQGGCRFSWNPAVLVCPHSSCRYLPPPNPIWACVFRTSGNCHCI
jgi:hypothetical protein